MIRLYDPVKVLTGPDPEDPRKVLAGFRPMFACADIYCDDYIMVHPEALEISFVVHDQEVIEAIQRAIASTPRPRSEPSPTKAEKKSQSHILMPGHGVVPVRVDQKS